MSSASSAYADVLREHTEFLADDDEAFTVTRTHPAPTVSYTLTVDSQNHPMQQTDAGAYVSMGDSIYGFVDASEHTPRINDQVTALDKYWRIVRVQPIRTLGSAVAMWDVELTAIENQRR